MKEGRIFPSIKLRSRRLQLLKNITTVLYIITSFYILFKDVKYLKLYSSLLRDIIPLDLRGLIS